MSRTFHDLAAVLLAMLCFAPVLLPPGYLLAHALDVQGFRGKSLAERLLWAVALSVPVATLLTVFCGRHLSAGSTSALIGSLSAVWLVLLTYLAVQGRLFCAKPGQTAPLDRWTVWTAGTMVAVALYTALATLGITVGRKLYEGTYAGDWSVRIPLTAAAIYGRVPILTPFYAISGQASPLRYYYYWYVVCGAVGRIAHLGARPVLAASSAWSAFALVAVFFLMARYLFGFSEVDLQDRQRRWLYWLMLPISWILGLDVLPAVAGLLLPGHKLYPEIEWWRAQGDFSLSFHTAVLYAPHHTAGLACCMLGFLLLTLTARRDTQPAWRAVVTGAVLAGICFAAAVGMSTYLTLLFAIVCTLLAAERALARDGRAVVAIALAGIVALPLSTTYLHEILSGSGATLHAESTHIHGARFVAFFPRNVGLPGIQLVSLRDQILGHRTETPLLWKLLLRPPMTVMLFVIELGFFGIVLARRAWLDLRRPRALTAVQRMQWVLFTGLAFPALCLTSEPVIGVNDLGRHAGLALRFLAVLWATPMVAEALQQPRFWPMDAGRGSHRTAMRLVYATVLLGVCTQAWQAAVQRGYFWLVDRGTVRYPFAPFPRFAHYGARYFEAREALEAMDRNVGTGDHVQFNPASTYWTAMTDYLDRPVAAFDVDCQAAFGGDLDRCHRAMPSIRGLFGGGKPESGPVQTFDPAGITAAAFDRVCAEQKLTAVIATASDRVWTERQSWLWTRPALFANRSIRIVRCDP